MLVSLALIFLVGMILGKMFERLKLPQLLGMLLTGILLGPYVFNLLDSSILSISPALREIALIIILTRAGLNLDLKDLKKVGRPAFLMCFVPATFELIGMILLGPLLFNITVVEAAVIGSVVAAVSPAVVVPRMLNIMENGYGTKKGIPQMVLAGASVDDVFVIVLFTAFTGLAQSGEFTYSQLLVIPTSIILGVLGGGLIGYLLFQFFTKFHIRDTGEVIVILCTAFLLVSVEDLMIGMIGFSGLLAVMALGMMIQKKNPALSKRLSVKFSKLWYGAEVMLFVLVGATVNIEYTFNAGLSAIILIFGVLLFRIVGVWMSLMRTKLTIKEKVFTIFAYLPKATVQAAIGGVPLAMGLAVGELTLSIAVLSIILTAPLGAILIDSTYKKFLTKSNGGLN